MNEGSVDMHRKYSRFTSNCYANISINQKCFERVKIKDLGVNGIFLLGSFPAAGAGDICELKLQGIEEHADLTLTVTTRIVRITKEGIALELEENEESDYSLLQTILLYCSNDPFGTAQELPEVLSEPARKKD